MTTTNPASPHASDITSVASSDLNTTTTSRSSMLKEATQSAHNDAERSTFMDSLLQGHYDLKGVIALNNELFHIYTALESGSEQIRQGDQFPHILSPELDGRAERIAHDIEALGGSISVPLDATTQYARAIGADTVNPAAFIGHHYTRYLGDLSGGQIIRTHLNRNLGIDLDALSFYDYSNLGKLKPFKDQYRSALDEINFSTDQDQQLVDAAVRSFHYNIDLFSALDAHLQTEGASDENSVA